MFSSPFYTDRMIIEAFKTKSKNIEKEVFVKSELYSIGKTIFVLMLGCISNNNEIKDIKGKLAQVFNSVEE